MIYKKVSAGTPIRQGDILKNIPRIDYSLNNLSVLVPNDLGKLSVQAMPWEEAIFDDEVIENIDDTTLLRIILPASPVNAIVITQDCDAMRADTISLCEITPLHVVFKNAQDITSTKSWVKNLIKQDTTTAKWFYLPNDNNFGFTKRMAVDFMSVLRLPSPSTDQLENFRIGRLSDVAYEHFKDKLSHFFKRYPVNPWYPLSKEEFMEYERNYPGSEPYPWQK